MTAAEFRAALEAECYWRQEELALLKNQLYSIPDEENQNRYRKSMVLILYSHMEGFVKTALQTYIQFINAQNLRSGDVIPELTAAGLQRVFSAYDNLDRKNKYFRGELPNDTTLHRYYRRVDFIKQMDEFKSIPLKIDDSVIETESNLRYIVLQKNLYLTGLPVDTFQQHEQAINQLVNRRNAIAHGAYRKGVGQQEFAQWENAAFEIMSDIMKILYEHAKHQKYLHPALQGETL